MESIREYIKHVSWHMIFLFLGGFVIFITGGAPEEWIAKIFPHVLPHITPFRIAFFGSGFFLITFAIVLTLHESGNDAERSHAKTRNPTKPAGEELAVERDGAALRVVYARLIHWDAGTGAAGPRESLVQYRDGKRVSLKTRKLDEVMILDQKFYSNMAKRFWQKELHTSGMAVLRPVYPADLKQAFGPVAFTGEAGRYESETNYFCLSRHYFNGCRPSSDPTKDGQNCGFTLEEDTQRVVMILDLSQPPARSAVSIGDFFETDHIHCKFGRDDEDIKYWKPMQGVVQRDDGIFVWTEENLKKGMTVRADWHARTVA